MQVQVVSCKQSQESWKSQLQMQMQVQVQVQVVSCKRDYEA
jgi:hypothetical protein